ncbi:MAG: hypothetical protein GF308_00295 [Candidatus Heimdallarchaeota archaeon]|nr:hypothetical protein [Candidatus Heimdallarchaeota archaeon]
MSKALKLASKFSIIFLLTLALSPFFITGVSAITDIRQPKTLSPNEIYTYQVRRFRNQRFTFRVSFEEGTSQEGDHITFLICRQNDFDLYENGTDPSQLETVQYYDANVTSLNHQFVVPDNHLWYFVFHNRMSRSTTFDLWISHQHLYGWIWWVVPLVFVVGLTAYGLIDHFTRYARARITKDKALDSLSSDDENEVRRAVYWLAQNGSKDDLKELLEMLNKEDPQTRANAITAIGELADVFNDKSVVPTLIKQYEKEEKQFIKVEIVKALYKLKDERAVPILSKYLLRPKNEKLRYQIAVTLGDIGSVETVSVLSKIIEEAKTDALKRAARKSLDKIASQKGISVEDLKKEHASPG